MQFNPPSLNSATRRPIAVLTGKPFSLKKPSTTPSVVSSSLPSSLPSYNMLINKSKYVSHLLSADQVFGIVVATIAIFAIIIFVATYGKKNRNITNQITNSNETIYNPMTTNNDL